MTRGAKFKRGLSAFGRSLIWLIPLLFLLDLATKLICYYQNVDLTVIPGFFFLRLERNTGAAGSLLADYPAVLAVLSVVSAIGLSVYLGLRYHRIRPWYRVTLYLMIAGCVGNMIDRIGQFIPGTIYYPDGVIDFLAFRFGSWDFPVFNVADMCLVVGVGIALVLLLIDEILHYKEKNRLEDTIARVDNILKSADLEEEKLLAIQQIRDELATFSSKELSRQEMKEKIDHAISELQKWETVDENPEL